MKNNRGFVSAALVAGLALAAVIILAIIGAAFGIIGSVMNLTGVADRGAAESGSADSGASQISDRFTAIDADGVSGTLTIREGDGFSAHRSGSEVMLSVSDGVLKIKQREGFSAFFNGFFNTGRSDVIVTVPSGTELDSLKLSGFAGRTLIEDITTGELYIDSGAGSLELSRVTALKKADINGGAGKFTVADCAFNNAELDLGVGKTDFSGVLAGSASVDCGVGAVDMVIKAPRELFTVKINKGIGSVSVDGRNVSDNETVGSGENRIDLSCGVGSVKLRFD